VEVFHAGTRKENGRILANGGRVLDVTAMGKNFAEAGTRAYAAVDKIVWPEGFCRRDIGARAVERGKAAGGKRRYNRPVIPGRALRANPESRGPRRPRGGLDSGFARRRAPRNDGAKMPRL